MYNEIIYDIIKTLRKIIKILEVINKILHGIMKILPDIKKNIFLIISKRNGYRQIWHDVVLIVSAITKFSIVQTNQILSDILKNFALHYQNLIGIVRILCDNIKTIHGVMKIIQAIKKSCMVLSFNPASY